MNNNWEEIGSHYLIPANFFYRNENEKNQGNWFMYELTKTGFILSYVRQRTILMKRMII